MKIKFISLAILSIAFVSCQTGKSSSDRDVQNLSTPAVYLGTLPCADCDGMGVALTLEDNKHATYKTEYMGHESTFNEKGTYAVEDNILKLLLPHDTLQFAVAEDSLMMVTQGGNSEESSLAAYYVLHKRKEFNYVGDYVLSGDEAGGYTQSLKITPEGKQYRVQFSASKVKDKENCSCSELGTIKNDTLFVSLKDPNKGVTMCIAPSHDQLGVEVFTTKFDDRHALMWYCGGGGSLAGDYYKATITNNTFGVLTSENSIKDLLSKVPLAQIEQKKEQGEHTDDIYENYTVYSREHQPLFSVSPKGVGNKDERINRILVLNPLFRTEKGVNTLSTFGQIRKAYNLTRIEPDKENIVVIVDAIHGNFSISKKKLPDTWWNEKTKSVDASQIPDTTTIDNFILWWE